MYTDGNAAWAYLAMYYMNAKMYNTKFTNIYGNYAGGTS